MKHLLNHIVASFFNIFFFKDLINVCVERRCSGVLLLQLLCLCCLWMYTVESGVCEAPLGGLFNLWILTLVPFAQGHPWALGTGYIWKKKKKTLDTKISPDTVVVQNERRNLEEERERERQRGVCVFAGGGGSCSSQGSVNTYLLNNIYYYPGKKDTVLLPDIWILIYILI